MRHLRTDSFDQLQFVEHFAGDQGIYVELTPEPGRSDEVVGLAESLRGPRN
jgi:hypothetical protein